MMRTPIAAPTRPPSSSTLPSFRSTLPSRKCTAVPEAEVATMALLSEAAATVGGTPIIIRIGVIRKPPPTPTRPDRKPTTMPTPTSRKTLMLVPATGRRISIAFLSLLAHGNHSRTPTDRIRPGSGAPVG